jgi:hypothetical protein
VRSKIHLFFPFLVAATLSLLTRPASAQSESRDAVSTPQGFVVAPGFFWQRGGIDKSSQGAFGRELSLNLAQNEQGAFSFAGIVVGADDDHTYSEIQAGGSGWLLASLVLGVGGAKARDVDGVIPQGTLSLQLFTPFFVYARAHARPLHADNTGGGAKLHWGIMFKAPIPLEGRRSPLL